MVKVNFSIRSGKKVINQTFNIATETKMVEDVVVTKLLLQKSSVLTHIAANQTKLVDFQ